MKRYCKKIDLTDRNLIERAIRDCLFGRMKGKRRGKNKLGRRDTVKLLSEYSSLPEHFIKQIIRERKYEYLNGTIETIVDGMAEEIRNRAYRVRPIWYTTKVDGSSGKIRRIGIQDIKQQLYDYIAVYALEEMLNKKIGFYQCSAIKDKGQLMAAKAIKRWIDNPNMRYVWKADIKHFYESIDREKLMELLEKSIKNNAILHLVRFLINTFEKGLAIGSFLSQYLANFFLSFAYHYASGLYKERRKKNGTVERVNLVHRELFYMDDILLVGSSMKDIKMAAKRMEEFITSKLHLKLKEGSGFIDLRTGYIDMMGFKISRRSFTMRSRIFLKIRHLVKLIELHKRKGIKISSKIFAALNSLNGWVKNTWSDFFKKKYNYQYALKAGKAVCNA